MACCPAPRAGAGAVPEVAAGAGGLELALVVQPVRPTRASAQTNAAARDLRMAPYVGRTGRRNWLHPSSGTESDSASELASMPNAVIVDAVRTPVGRRGGRLSGWHATDLAAQPLAALAGPQ